MTGRLTVLIATGAVLLMAAACTDSDPRPNYSTVSPSGTPAATGAPSATPTVKPTPTIPADVPTTGTNLLSKGERPPVMPAVALEHTDAGAQAFAKFYLQTVDWGYATTNASYMRHYYDKVCVRCKILDDAITGVARHRWLFIGGRSHTRSFAFSERNSSGSDVVFQAISALDSGTAVDAKGNIHAAAVASPDFHEKVGVRWSGTAWRATYMFGSNA
jgi:hypothetical protein